MALVASCATPPVSTAPDATPTEARAPAASETPETSAAEEDASEDEYEDEASDDPDAKDEASPAPCDPGAELAETGFRGLVLWRGEPVAGYRVELREWTPPLEGRLHASATTDAGGAFTLRGSPLGVVGLWLQRQPPYVFRGYSLETCGGQVLDIGEVEILREIRGLSIGEGQLVDAGPLAIRWSALDGAEYYCVGLFSGGRSVIGGSCGGQSGSVRVDGTSYTTPPLMPGTEYFFEIGAYAAGHVVGETQAGIVGFRVR